MHIERYIESDANKILIQCPHFITLLHKDKVLGASVHIICKMEI
jgi:hypothetical protein